MSEPGIGHNGIDAGHLTALLERIERANDEVKAAQDDRKEIYSEAKSMGFSVGTLRQIVKLRAMDPNERHEQQIMLSLYMSAVGME